ncbi:MAG: R3H domain-containing nucleic acid-binding protein [Patescibacteria group bacterium]|jgi:spoIIIJ-associated protein
MSLSKIKIQKTAQNLIGHFDPEAEIELISTDGIWYLNISSDMSPMLIGRYGQTLKSLEHILRLILAKQAEEFLAINLDISGYKAAREQQIAENAKETARKVLETGESEDLPPMNAYERRLAHMVLSDIEGIETESVGIEPYRKIIVKKSNR